jgi:hypothetical protein
MFDSNDISINNASLKSIERRVNLYKQGNISLPQLAQDLFTIMSGMFNVPKEWQDKFMSLWSIVEEVNALALSEDSCKPLPDHEELLQKALNEIQTLAHKGFAD